MKTRLATAALLFGAALAQAGTLYWDPGRTGTTTGGGNGGWFDAAAWYDADADANVSWAGGSDAVLGGTAGRIQLNGVNGDTVNAGTLTFGTAGYIVDLSAANGTGTTTLNLTATGIGGEDGRIVKSVEGGNWRNFVLTLAMGTVHTWPGEVGGTGSTRMSFTKDGGGTLNIRRVDLGGWGQPTLQVAGGRLNLTGNDNAGGGSLRLIVAGTGILDLGGNVMSARQIALAKEAAIMTAGSGRIRHAEGRWDSAVYEGLLTGSLGVVVAAGYDLANNRESRITSSNDYTGGTFFEGTMPNGSRVGLLRVTRDNGLGSGPVVLQNSDGTARLILESPTPVIGSLESANAGAKEVWLGKTGIDTTLTVGTLAEDTAFAGTISEVAGQIGSLTKVGDGTLTLSGANTYTGTTRVEGGTLRVTHATAGLAACRVQVAGGTFAGPASSGTGTVAFNLDAATPEGIVMTSGALELTRLAVSFSGTPNQKSYTLVDYSAGGTFTGAANPGTANTFAAAGNVPDGYKWLHDTAAKKVLLFLPPSGTVWLVR